VRLFFFFGVVVGKVFGKKPALPRDGEQNALRRFANRIVVVS
jgi:hypothetical protein